MIVVHCASVLTDKTPTKTASAGSCQISWIVLRMSGVLVKAEFNGGLCTNKEGSKMGEVLAFWWYSFQGYLSQA